MTISADSTVLPAARAVVTGDGATARVLRAHLAALGATVRCTPGQDAEAARVRLTVGDLVRELVVGWAGPVEESGIVDETTAQAVCGVMAVHGRRGGVPRGLALDFCASAAGVLGMTGLLASLIVEEEAATVATSVAEAALLGVTQYLAAAGSDDPEAVDLRPGGPPFTSSDGIRFEIETLLPERWAGFWAEVGADRRAVARGWRPFQLRYAVATAALPAELAAAAARLRFAALEAAGARSGVDVCRLRGAREIDPSAGGAPWRMATAAGTGLRAGVGSLTRPLKDVSVLEAGRRVQAPLAAHLLGLLGASVVRVEPPGGDPLRGMPPCCGPLSARWLALNRDKTAVQVDIRSAEGRERLRALAAQADVFVHNWAPGTALRYRLEPEDLAGPAVYAYTSGWGGSTIPDPPMGTDFVVQARTGLAELLQPADEPPAPSLMTVLDVLGGLLGAEAVLAALLRSRRCGARTCVESSLYGAAGVLRAPGCPQRRPAGYRMPARSGPGWTATPDGGGRPVEVSTDLTALVADSRMAAVIGRDEHGCPTLTTPWRFS